jgi:hypothetical protein
LARDVFNTGYKTLIADGNDHGLSSTPEIVAKDPAKIIAE